MANYTVTSMIFHDDENGNIYEVRPQASAMTGASDSANGTSGSVPTPHAGDEVAFLRGDGTWVVAATDSDIDALFT